MNPHGAKAPEGNDERAPWKEMASHRELEAGPFTDTDDTGGATVAYYGDIAFTSE